MTIKLRPTVFAISDLHLDHQGNRDIAEALRPDSAGDWLIVAGDIAHRHDEIIAFLARMRDRFEKVIFTPGNHDLWTVGATEPRGEDRYRRLVASCRATDVLTPEDPYPLWQDAEGPIAVAPLFLLYDYTLRPEGLTKDQVFSTARVHCNDEVLLSPHPYPDRESWCAARLAYTQVRLDALPEGMRTVLISHWPLHPGPLKRLWYPEFGLWCGTRHTADWHRRYRAVCSVYGHLHIPVSDVFDGVRHDEVSLGYPRERAARTGWATGLRTILPIR